MIEFQDDIPALDASLLPPFARAFLWDRWDTVLRGKRVKLHWGIFRPSFRLAVFEPLVVQLLGPRPDIVSE